MSSQSEHEPAPYDANLHGLHPDIPVEEPPYDAELYPHTEPALHPNIPVADLPYPEELEADTPEETIVSPNHLKGEENIPKTLAGHVIILDAAINEAIQKGRSSKPLIYIGDAVLTIPKYLALIPGGSKSGLTLEERQELNRLYEEWLPIVSSEGKVSANLAATALGHAEGPKVVTTFEEDDDPWAAAQERRHGGRDDRIAP